MNSKATDQRHQRILLDLVKQPGNDVCADCKGRTPRWASWNLGVFVCVQCAGVHRKMGTHISKIKSLNLDSWTREQVDRMKEVGNVKSNALYNPDEVRNRPPMNIEESERDSELEKYIRRKYEFRTFVEKAPPPVPVKDASARRHLKPVSPRGSQSRGTSPVQPQRSGQASLAPRAVGGEIARSNTAPIPASWSDAVDRSKSTSPSIPIAAPALPVRASSKLEVPTHSNGAQAISVPNEASQHAQAQRLRSASAVPAPVRSSVFDDLISLQTPVDSTPQPPIQMTPWATLQHQQQPVMSPISMGSGSMYGQNPHTAQHANTFPFTANGTMAAQQQPLASPSASLYPTSAYDASRSATSLGNAAFSQSPSLANGVGNNPFLAPGSNGMGVSVGSYGIGGQGGMMGLAGNSLSSGMAMSAPSGFAGMGQVNFGSPTSPYSGGSPSPVQQFGNNPYAQQALQQQQPQPTGFNSFANGMMPGQQSQQQQQQFQSTNPYAQQQYSAQPQSPWGQPQQNMWG